MPAPPYRRSPRIETAGHPVVSDPCDQLAICATSDGGARGSLASGGLSPLSTSGSTRTGAPRWRAVSTVHPAPLRETPQHLPRIARINRNGFHRLCAANRIGCLQGIRSLDAALRRRPGIGPQESVLPRSTNCRRGFGARPGYEHFGAVAPRGKPEALLRSGANHHRRARSPCQPSLGPALAWLSGTIPVPGPIRPRVCELNLQLAGSGPPGPGR